MADITRGKTFTSNEEVTNTKLHQLVDAATISNITSSDLQLTTSNTIFIGSVEPTDTNQRFWYDTVNNLFLVRDEGDTFQPVGRGHEYTNKSGVSVDASDVVILDTANATAVKTTTDASSTDAWGVCANSAANDAAVFVITEGFVPAVKVTGATAIGDYLFTSTTEKRADPSSTAVSGAFARALTADSSAVAAQLIGGGSLQSVASSTLFEIEADREASVSTTFGSPTTVTFDTAFAEPPIVIATVENITATNTVSVISVTTTSFTIYGSASGPFNWIAATAGTFEVSSGVIIQSGTVSTNTAVSGNLTAYQTGKTPSICGSIHLTDDIGGFNTFTIFNRMFGGDATTNLNFAGRSSGVAIDTQSNISGEVPCFILSSQTSTVQTGNTATADGTQGALGLLAFEAGVVMQVTSTTPSLTFQTTFSVAPAVLITGETRSDLLSGSATTACLNAVPTSSGFVPRLNSTDERSGYNWIAIEKGHTTVSTAVRLG